jgi:hypothetical protein
MKTRISKTTGSALLVTMVITASMGAALAGYMKLVEYQNRAVVRSQYWNTAIPVGEAGIEEALTHLNKVGDGNRATNGWTLRDGKYYLTRTVGDSRYEVWINSSNQPSITAIGYVKEPISQTEVKRTIMVNTTKSGSGMRGIITKLAITMNGNTRIDSFDSSDPLLSTFGRYDAAKSHDMGYAGSVNSSIDTGAGGVWGYIGTGASGTATGNAGDSAWMSSSTGVEPGHYSKDLNLAFPNASVPFSGGGLTPLANQTVATTNFTYLSNQVTVATLPVPLPVGGVTTNWSLVTSVTKPLTWSGTLFTNTVAMSTTTYPLLGTYVGNVVTRAVVTKVKGISVTTLWYDYTAILGYASFAVSYSFNGISTNRTLVTNIYNYVTDSGNYEMSSLSMSGGNQMLVRGDTVLSVTGDFSMSGNSQITILPGASLTIYVAGSASLSGNGIWNLNQDATKMTIYGLPSCTSITLSGNAAYTGTIYAPNAAVSFNGSGNTIYDCVGAVVGKSADFHGNFNFHYDENLGRAWGPPVYKVAYWSEI